MPAPKRSRAADGGRSTSAPPWSVSHDPDEESTVHHSRLVHVGLPLIIPAAIALTWPWQSLYWNLIHEDGPIEWATAIAYLLSSFLMAAVAIRLRGTVRTVTLMAVAALAVLFFAVAGEEISWGQRLFALTGPEALITANRQHEMNLHNLLKDATLHGGYLLVAFYGMGLGRWVAKRIRLVPVWAVAPPKYLFFWFLPLALHYFTIDYLKGGARLVGFHSLERWALSLDGTSFEEVTECVMAIGMMLFAADALRRSRLMVQALHARPEASP